MSQDNVLSRINEQWQNMDNLLKGGAVTRTGTTTKSVKVMMHRGLFSSVAAVYGQASFFLKGANEKKKKPLNYLNWFLERNIAHVRLYFNHAESLARATVAAPYLVSEGTLDSIKLEAQGNILESSLLVPEGFALTASTTVSQLSVALITANYPTLHSRHKISILHQIQEFTPDGMPVTTLKLYQFVLDRNNSDLFYDRVPGKLFAVTANRRIGTETGVAEGALAYIRSREDDKGKLYISTQHLVLTPNNLTYAKYGSAEKQAEAEASYMLKDNYLLRPSVSMDDLEGGEDADLFFSLVSVFKNGTLVPKAGGELEVNTGDQLELKGKALTAATLQVRAIDDDPTSDPADMALSNLGTVTAFGATSIKITINAYYGISHIKRADTGEVVYQLA